ncbi:hypothetical protein GCM10010254_28440 [Streptomyces chromofuscus]|nr:hypothetical protein GCM10010254_28440 [Streptomyces chromofuscus]
MGDDGGVGAGFEGGRVAGEAPLALLDRLACLGLPGCVGPCCDCCGAGVGEGFEGGGEPVGGEGPGDVPVQDVADHATTLSPRAMSHWARCRPSPLAFSTAHLSCGHRLAQAGSRRYSVRLASIRTVPTC